MSDNTPLWKRALGHLVELDETSPTPPSTPQAAKPPTATSSLTAPVVIASPIDQGLHDALMRAGLQRKTTFSGVVEAAERLRIVPNMDDTQRIKAAAAMAGTVTAEMITQAAAGHIGDIALERSKFGREIAASRSTRVDTVATQATNLENQVKSAQTEIQRLNTQVVELTEQANSLRVNATTADAEIVQTIATFEATAAQVEQFITSTRDAIVSALK